MSNIEIVKKQIELLNMIDKLKRRREKMKSFINTYINVGKGNK